MIKAEAQEKLCAEIEMALKIKSQIKKNQDQLKNLEKHFEQIRRYLKICRATLLIKRNILLLGNYLLEAYLKREKREEAISLAFFLIKYYPDPGVPNNKLIITFRKFSSLKQREKMFAFLLKRLEKMRKKGAKEPVNLMIERLKKLELGSTYKQESTSRKARSKNCLHMGRKYFEYNVYWLALQEFINANKHLPNHESREHLGSLSVILANLGEQELLDKCLAINIPHPKGLPRTNKKSSIFEELSYRVPINTVARRIVEG